MKLPINVLEQINNFVGQLDEEDHLTPRQEAIRETARLLVFLTHDEFYSDDCLSMERYEEITKMCDDVIYNG